MCKCVCLFLCMSSTHLQAYELLTSKQRAYDSVDPTFDDSVPQVTEVNKKNFFETFSPVFERNKRWMDG